MCICKTHTRHMCLVAKQTYTPYVSIHKQRYTPYVSIRKTLTRSRSRERIYRESAAKIKPVRMRSAISRYGELELR